MDSAKLAAVVQHAADFTGRSDLHVVVQVLKSAGNATVKATVKKLTTILKASPMQATDASDFINDLAKLMKLSAARSAHSDLAAVADVASRFGDYSSDDLIALMNKPKPPAKKAIAKLDPTQLRRMADELVAAGRSKSAFDAVLADVEKLKKADLVSSGQCIPRLQRLV